MQSVHFTDAELDDFLNRMLEAERAGAKALIVFLDDWPRHGAEWAMLRKIHEDEAHNCSLIGAELKRRGRAYSHATGEFYDKADEELVLTIKELLDTRVRPAVAQDGGDITFRGFENGTVFLHMKGACAGCPSSTATLKHGIQNLLRHFVPEVTEVRPV